MKKRLLAILLATGMCMGLAACGGDEPAAESSAPVAESSAPEAPAVEWVKNVEVQLPASAGGGTDVAARAVVQYINENTDYNLTVVNNNDGGGVVAYETVRNAKTDGSTILFFHSSMCIKKATGLYDHDPATDFTVIGYSDPKETGGYVLLVPADAGIATMDDFVAAAKTEEMLIGVETGGSSHIMAGLLSEAIDADLKYVEAGPDTEKLTALVGGSIDCALINPNQAKQYIEAGKAVALGCFTTDEAGTRGSVLPDVPSFVELGYDLTYGTNFFVLAPKGMDPALAELINGLFAEAVTDPATDELLSASGFGMTFRSFEESADGLAAQQTTLDAVVESLGLKQ